MYKVAIIYTGVAYESEVNNIRLQELLGKLKLLELEHLIFMRKIWMDIQ